MKAAADLAAATGMVLIPEGLSVQDAMAGLIANVPRIRATRIIDMARSISLVISDTDKGQDVMKAAGMNDDDIQQNEVARWKSEAIARAKR